MRKIWNWIKKYAHIIVLAIGGVIGFIVGRKSVPSVGQGIAELRADNEQLREYVEQLRGQLDSLRELNRISTEQQRNIEHQLGVAREALERERENLEQGRLEIGQLRESHQRLRNLIETHRAELENIQVFNDSASRGSVGSSSILN